MITRKDFRVRACLITTIIIIIITSFIRYNDTRFNLLSLKTSIIRKLRCSIFGSVVSKADLHVHGTPFNSKPNEGFVTFSDAKPKYVALLNHLIDSVHRFSSRPILVYGIDIDIDIDTQKYPRVIQKRLSRADCGSSVYFCKILAMIDSKLDYGIQLEADSVVNWDIDILFDVLHKWPYPLPLAPRHPQDPVNYKSFLRYFDLDLNSRTIPYIHAQFSWTYRAYPFLRQALDLMQRGYFTGANFDESGMNILLWKAEANHTLCKIDPYFSFLSEYAAQRKICKEYCHTAFLLIHGSKLHTDFEKSLKVLQQHVGDPYIQTVVDGFHYPNETAYSCCYPDSRPSPIHPLLCEYSKRYK